jgi:hypothetical protein
MAGYCGVASPATILGQLVGGEGGGIARKLMRAANTPTQRNSFHDQVFLVPGRVEPDR